MDLSFISRLPTQEWERREKRTRGGALLPSTPLPPLPGVTTIPASVIELDDDPSWSRGYQRWRDEVMPLIRNDRDMPDRADRHWDWQKHRNLARVAGMRRRSRFFQLRVGMDQRPAAMVVLLEAERWPGDHALPAVYLWYLSVAPRAYLTYDDGSRPLDVGLAAIDIAVTVSLSGRASGRVWLHADPNAGQPDLCKFYGLSVNMARIPSGAVPTLPGYTSGGILLKRRLNDERYFALTPELSAWARQRLDWLRT